MVNNTADGLLIWYTQYALEYEKLKALRDNNGRYYYLAPPFFNTLTVIIARAFRFIVAVIM